MCWINVMTYFVLNYVFLYKISDAKTLRGHERLAYDFPYVVIVALKPGSKGICSGSLISPEWVLTAGHCLVPKQPKIVTQNTNYLRYVNDSSALTNNSNIYSNILKTFTTYESLLDANVDDVGLLYITKFPLVSLYGKVSHKTLSKLPSTSEVQFAGYGSSEPWSWNITGKVSKLRSPALHAGTGAIVECPQEIPKPLQPQLCVKPFTNTMPTRRSRRLLVSSAGDGGGPLVHVEEVIAVHSGYYQGFQVPIATFTPLENYVEWIEDIILKVSSVRV